MLRILFALGCLNLIAGCAHSRETKLQLVVEGREVALNADVCDQVIAKVERIVESANFNSLHHPQYFTSSTTLVTDDPGDTYIRVEYPDSRTIDTLGGLLSVTTIDVPLERRDIPGPFVLHDGVTRVLIGKESGVECVRLTRIPGLADYMPSQVQQTWAKYNYVQ